VPSGSVEWPSAQAHRAARICTVTNMNKKLRNAMLFVVFAGPVVLLAPPAGAQLYVPPPNPVVIPAVVPTVLGETLTQPQVEAPKGGTLSRTGAETMPLVRDGLAALALGLGLVALARRRRGELVPI
jgi:hypothetical protein